MTRHMKWRMTLLAAVTIATLAGYGFAASATVESSLSGDGSGTIKGYEVSNVQYTFGNPFRDRITAVSFTLDTAANEVFARFPSPGTGAWRSCIEVTSNTWFCVGFNEPVAAVEQLEVSSAK